MRDVDPLGTPVSLGAVAPVTLGAAAASDSSAVPSPAADSVSAAASGGAAASGVPVFGPTTASVFSVRDPKSSWRSRRIEVFLSSTSSVT